MTKHTAKYGSTHEERAHTTTPMPASHRKRAQRPSPEKKTAKTVPDLETIYQAAKACKAEDAGNKTPCSGFNHLPENTASWAKVWQDVLQRYNLSRGELLYAFDIKHKLLDAFKAVLDNQPLAQKILKEDMIYGTVFHWRIHKDMPNSDFLGVDTEKLARLFNHGAIPCAEGLDLEKCPEDLLADYLISIKTAKSIGAFSRYIQPDGYTKLLENMKIKPPSPQQQLGQDPQGSQRPQSQHHASPSS